MVDIEKATSSNKGASCSAMVDISFLLLEIEIMNKTRCKLLPNGTNGVKSHRGNEIWIPDD
jgi:hypothetical protein